MAPRFESLPLEIRRMIYTYVLPRLEKLCKEEKFESDWGPLYHWTYVLQTANTAILRTNRNINQEASAVFYRNTLLVSIDWNTNSRTHLILVKIPHVTFNFRRPGAPLPPYAVQVQHKYHDGKSGAATTSTIVAATDFPKVCRLLLKANPIPRISERRASYSVISLPKIGYSVDELRELIWLPLKALRKGRLRENGERTHRNLRPIDRTGVFEKTAAMLDWDRELDEEDKTLGKAESDKCDSINDGSDTSFLGDLDSDEDGNDDKGNCKSDEPTGNKYCSSDPGDETSHRAASISGHDEKSKAGIVAKINSVAGGFSEDEPDHKVFGDDEVNWNPEIMDKRDAEEDRS